MALRLGDTPGPDLIRGRVNDAFEEIIIMYTEHHSVALPYELDPRFEELFDLVEALEAKWKAEREPEPE